MKKKISVRYIFTALFIFGVMLAGIGRIGSIRNTRNYRQLQPELFFPDVIKDVLHDSDLHRIYVCYNDASYVNVYTETGDFLWAVSVPFLNHSYFELQDGKLIVYGNDDAYIYDAADGTFIDCTDPEELSLEYTYSVSTDSSEDGAFYFDEYNVYAGRSDGMPAPIVTRPWWYYCFHFAVGWCIAFIGAIGIGFCILLDKRKVYLEVRDTAKLSSRRLILIRNYFAVTSAVHLLFSTVVIIAGLFGHILALGIFPIGIHFIISSGILYGKLDRMVLTDEEKAVMGYIKAAHLASIVIAFISVAASVLFAT